MAISWITYDVCRKNRLLRNVTSEWAKAESGLKPLLNGKILDPSQTIMVISWAPSKPRKAFPQTFFFYFLVVGWDWVHLVRRPLLGLLYQPRMINDGECESNRCNENWQGNPKYLEKTCPSATLSTTNSTWTGLSWNPGRRGGKPATNCLSAGTTLPKPWFRNIRCATAVPACQTDRQKVLFCSVCNACKQVLGSQSKVMLLSATSIMLASRRDFQLSKISFEVNQMGNIFLKQNSLRHWPFKGDLDGWSRGHVITSLWVTYFSRKHTMVVSLGPVHCHKE
jgi:hypothetical protein